MNYSVCRIGPRCRERILWVVMESGKKAPLNAQPDPERGNVLLDERGIGHALSKGTAAIIREQGDEDLYLNHHATCVEWEAQRAAGAARPQRQRSSAGAKKRESPAGTSDRDVRPGS